MHEGSLGLRFQVEAHTFIIGLMSAFFF
jgi:hypothetical protein